MLFIDNQYDVCIFRKIAAIPDVDYFFVSVKRKIDFYC